MDETLQDSLSARFRGALLGATIGNILAVQAKHSTIQRQGWFDLNPRLFPQTPPGRTDHLLINAWFADNTQPPPFQTAGAGAGQPFPDDRPPLPGQAELAILLLPIILTFHENETRLVQHLQQEVKTLATGFTQAGEIDSDLSGIGIIGRTIAHCLRGNFQPFNSLAQISRTVSPETPLGQLLPQIQTLVQQRAGLETIVGEFTKHPLPQDSRTIALALYCFLSTPHAFRLSLLRSLRTGHQIELTATLVGAFSGAHNGLGGIPAPWRLLGETHDRAFAPLTPVLRLADHLLAHWSGVYRPQSFPPGCPPMVAAPEVIYS